MMNINGTTQTFYVVISGHKWSRSKVEEKQYKTRAMHIAKLHLIEILSQVL